MASIKKKKNAALKTAVNKIHIILDRVGDLTSLDGTVILTNELMSLMRLQLLVYIPEKRNL